jgi:nucleoside-diphosphate-sugar epimerase
MSRAERSNVAIAGAGGFVGRALVSKLAQATVGAECVIGGSPAKGSASLRPPLRCAASAEPLPYE